MGESPVLHVSGFHHPALANIVPSVPDSPVNAFHISPIYYHIHRKYAREIFKKIPILDGKVNEWYCNFIIIKGA